MTKTGFTALSDFGRTVRDEPAYGVYSHIIYVTRDDVSSEEVHRYLKMRYTQARKGYLYRVRTYAHVNGNRYVDCIMLQTCNDKDLMEIKLRWGFSAVKIARGEKVPRRRLTKDQRVRRDAIIKRALEDFYNSL